MQIRSTASEVDFRQFLNINPLSSVDWLVFKNLILFLMRPFTKNPQFRAMLTSTCDLVRTLKPVQLLMKCNYRTDNNQRRRRHLGLFHTTGHIRYCSG